MIDRQKKIDSRMLAYCSEVYVLSLKLGVGVDWPQLLLAVCMCYVLHEVVNILLCMVIYIYIHVLWNRGWVIEVYWRPHKWISLLDWNEVTLCRISPDMILRGKCLCKLLWTLPGGLCWAIILCRLEINLICERHSIIIFSLKNTDSWTDSFIHKKTKNIWLSINWY